ncbi:MAG: MiaB/RimO family radical SAM methylthiotransferase [Gemmatimonadaceae bacterium]|jgi:threonylcarbamoyladenosine tRNA methylthiotransferase MtaB|nr:MiaB/RimO family radical SAM methylthiotransferase [Gemmatimonadaceae bacterium]
MRVHLATIGCRANQYDTETVAAMVAAAGGTVVETPHDADVALVNSCAVTAEAEADLRRQLRRIARVAPTVRTVVMGCASARDPDGVRALPTVSHAIAGFDATAVGEALALPPEAWSAAATRQGGARALLRVQDGCDEHCTFCATTLARGAQRSRPVDALCDEAERLADAHPEIVLTGIHVGTYGRDIGSSLSALVLALMARVPAVRFRLASVEATEVDDALAELLAGAPRQLAPSLHAPLQSGSDAVLRRMGRHWYTAASYARAVERLVRRAPVFGLGADVIVGFPGETDADFAATEALVRALPFTALHVFPYSPRPGTAALRLGDPPAAAVVAVRREALRALAEEKAARHRRSRDGGAADLVIVGRPDGDRTGLSEDYLSVRLAAPAPPRATRHRATLACHDDDGRATLVARLAP